MHGTSVGVVFAHQVFFVSRWFKENSTRSAAEEYLRRGNVGEFVIRGSQSSPGDFSISVKWAEERLAYPVYAPSSVVISPLLGRGATQTKEAKSRSEEGRRGTNGTGEAPILRRRRQNKPYLSEVDISLVHQNDKGGGRGIAPCETWCRMNATGCRRWWFSWFIAPTSRGSWRNPVKVGFFIQVDDHMRLDEHLWVRAEPKGQEDFLTSSFLWAISQKVKWVDVKHWWDLNLLNQSDCVSRVFEGATVEWSEAASQML